MRDRYEVRGEDSGNLLGWAKVNDYHKSPGTHSFLARMKVRNDYQGMGIGSELMKQMIQDADREHRYLVTQPEPDDNQNPERWRQLHRFYEKHGFVGSRIPGALWIRSPRVLSYVRP